MLPRLRPKMLTSLRRDKDALMDLVVTLVSNRDDITNDDITEMVHRISINRAKRLGM
jgi:hypothetical protein